MNINDLKEMPIWQMTGEEFIFLAHYDLNKKIEIIQKFNDADIDTTHVYGLKGIAKLFDCSIPTANRIKQSGKIDKAISQVGRKIIVDAKLALKLASQNK